MLKKLTIILLSLFGVAVISLLLSGNVSYFLAYKSLEKIYGWEISTRQGNFDLINGAMALDGIRLGSHSGPGPGIQLEAEHVRLTIALSELLHGRLVLDRLSLEGLHLIYVSPAAPSEPVLETFKQNSGVKRVQKQNARDESGILVRVLMIKNGNIEIVQEKSTIQKSNVILENIDITAHDVYLGKGLEVFLKTLLKADIDPEF